MANENALQKELEKAEKVAEDAQREYEKLQEEYEEMLANSESGLTVGNISISNTVMHVFNISLAAIMVIIGGILAYQTRNIRQRSGKKIAGWILLVLGILTVIQHTVQLMFL